MDKDILKKVHHVQLQILDEIERICNKNTIEYYLIGGTLIGAVRHKGFIPWDDDIDIAMPRESFEKFKNECKNQLNPDYELDYHKINRYYWLPLLKVRKKGTIYAQKFQKDDDCIPQGIWVDIFPLDNVKHQDSLFQDIQAKIVYKLRSFITYKQEYRKPISITAKILFILLKPLSIEKAFLMQERVMTFWNKITTEYYVSLASRYGHKKQTILKSKYNPPVRLEFEGKYYNAPNDWDYVLKRIYGDYMKLPPEKERETHYPVRIKFDDSDKMDLRSGKQYNF